MVAVSSLAPYFSDVFDGEASRALADDRLEEAMRLFDDIAREVSDPVLTPRAQFLAAYLAHRTGDDARALADLPGLAHQLPVVADAARETAAAAALRLRKLEIAYQLAVAVDPRSASGENTALIRADVLRRQEVWPEAERAYREFLDSWPDSIRAREVESRLVECLTRIALAGEQVLQEPAEGALDLIGKLRAQEPGDRWTRATTSQEKELRKALDLPAAANKQEKPAAQQAYEKGKRHLAKARNKDAEKAFAKATRLATKGGDLQCRARLNKANAVARQRNHGQAAILYEEVAGDCTLPSVQVRALYQAGRSYVSSDKQEDALRMFEAVEQEYGTHSYADDARLRRARCHLALGDRETFLELISSLPDDYPQGDMRSEALWSAAYEAMKRNDLPSAKEVLAKYHALFPNEKGWYVAGRSGYWLGRVEELLGDLEKAAELYEQVIASSPLTHYMVLAHARLGRIDPERSSALIARLAPPGGEVAARFPESLLTSEPRLATGIELLRLGLTTKARREFDRLLADPDTTAEVHWIVAALFRRMGQYTEARQVASGLSGDWRSRYPAGEDLVRWTLAYPTAFEDEVATAAEESGVDPALLWAVMREESGFNAKIESWANAIGLMQLIMPTAKSMGRRLDIKVNKKALRTPETNIRLGAAYLAFLSEKFDSHEALMIAGYNAGEGAVARWLDDHPDAELDEFVELIPYHQTRGYTKRVLATLATYKFLYGDNRPLLTPELDLP
ncbi:MAG: transglycosylase SLT domain-containing protein [Deltaproteobacteria bacterium]|nr:transglycosylase SLT domain-containing protein [Deltaproteobacteria bacterium]